MKHDNARCLTGAGRRPATSATNFAPAPFRRLLLVAMAMLDTLLLLGCAHTVKLPLVGQIDNTPPPSRAVALQSLQSATPCCDAWGDLPFHDPLPREPRQFTLDQFSPVADLSGARTHFLTFVLPRFSQPYKVVFQAQPSARHLGSSFLLAPTVTLLNDNYQPLATTNVALCIYINWRPTMSGGFGAVQINNPDARYLVITTSPQQLAASTYWSQSPTSFGGVAVPSGSGFSGMHASTPVTSGSYQLPHGPEGVLTLGKMTPAYAEAVTKGMCGKPKQGAGLLPELRNVLHDR